MADESPYDIAMKFVLEGGGTVWAESTLRVDKLADKLMYDFNSVSDLSDYSNFFEVTTFDFSMSNEPDDGAAGGGGGRGGGAGAQGGAGGRGGGASPFGGGGRGGGRGGGACPACGRPPLTCAACGQPGGGRGGGGGGAGGGGGGGAGGGAGGAAGGGSSDPYHRWRSATEDQAKDMKFQLSFDSFRFTRYVDGASPSFFQNCARQVRFESAALVKRVSQGHLRGVVRPNLAFMRFDFKDVMLKSVKWDDGDLVTESCEFVCESLTFQYRQQKADGGLMAVSNPATWDRALDSERRKEGDTNG